MAESRTTAVEAPKPIRRHGWPLALRRRGAGRFTRRGLGLTGLIVGFLAMGISSAGAAGTVPTCNRDGTSPTAGFCQVDPASIPQGELALESQADTSFKIDVSGHMQHFRDGAEVTVEHFQFAAAGPATPGVDVSGWHSHGGPVFVEVLTGTLTVYQATGKTCIGKQYPAGTGFAEPGGVVHDARNEGSVPVDIYDTVVLPPGSGDAGIFIQQLDKGNPHCSFAQ